MPLEASSFSETSASSAVSDKRSKWTSIEKRIWFCRRCFHFLFGITYQSDRGSLSLFPANDFVSILLPGCRRVFVLTIELFKRLFKKAYRNTLIICQTVLIELDVYLLRLCCVGFIRYWEESEKFMVVFVELEICKNYSRPVFNC